MKEKRIVTTHSADSPCVHTGGQLLLYHKVGWKGAKKSPGARWYAAACLPGRCWSPFFTPSSSIAYLTTPPHIHTPKEPVHSNFGGEKKKRWNIRRKVARQKQNYHTRNAGGCSSILFRTLFFKSSLSLSILLFFRDLIHFYFFFFSKRGSTWEHFALFLIFLRALNLKIK